MSPEHFQLIISDLYEENYKSDFAKDLRENIDDLTDFDWMYQYREDHGVGSGDSFNFVGGSASGRFVGGNLSSNSFVGGIGNNVGGFASIVGIGGGNVEGFNGGFGNIVGGDN